MCIGLQSGLESTHHLLKFEQLMNSVYVRDIRKRERERKRMSTLAMSIRFELSKLTKRYGFHPKNRNNNTNILHIQ